VLEVLRQPLEDGFVTIARAQATLAYPANLMLVAALNPCPCGYFGDPDHQRYLHKISGPLLDRIDIHIKVPRTNINDLESERTSENSAMIKERGRNARALQQHRFEQINS
jgi:magnesium chelatase family protein